MSNINKNQPKASQVKPKYGWSGNPGEKVATMFAHSDIQKVNDDIFGPLKASGEISKIAQLLGPGSDILASVNRLRDVPISALASELDLQLQVLEIVGSLIKEGPSIKSLEENAAKTKVNQINDLKPTSERGIPPNNLELKLENKALYTYSSYTDDNKRAEGITRVNLRLTPSYQGMSGRIAHLIWARNSVEYYPNHLYHERERFRDLVGQDRYQVYTTPLEITKFGQVITTSTPSIGSRINYTSKGINFDCYRLFTLRNAAPTISTGEIKFSQLSVNPEHKIYPVDIVPSYYSLERNDEGNTTKRAVWRLDSIFPADNNNVDSFSIGEALAKDGSLHGFLDSSLGNSWSFYEFCFHALRNLSDTARALGPRGFDLLFNTYGFELSELGYGRMSYLHECLNSNGGKYQETMDRLSSWIKVSRYDGNVVTAGAGGLDPFDVSKYISLRTHDVPEDAMSVPCLGHLLAHHLCRLHNLHDTCEYLAETIPSRFLKQVNKPESDEVTHEEVFNRFKESMGYDKDLQNMEYIPNVSEGTDDDENVD